MNDAVVFDIDGVLSDSCHRHYLIPDWDEFYKLIPGDTPCYPMIKLLNMFYWDMEYDVILLTSRPESVRRISEDWLFKYEVPFKRLLMRPDDLEDGPQWKLEQIKNLRKKYIIHWIFDDAPKNIELLKSNNFPIIAVLSGYYTEEVI